MDEKLVSSGYTSVPNCDPTDNSNNTLNHKCNSVSSEHDDDHKTKINNGLQHQNYVTFSENLMNKNNEHFDETMDIDHRNNSKNVQNDVMHHQKELNKIADPDRETWGKKVDFLLSVIGFAVDLANVWRFPYLCYKNGGGAFLIPYVLMLVLGGIPLFYMELALGQFNRKGAITCWSRICPLLKGIGFTVVLIAFYTDFYYNVIISWALYYFFASFSKKLPWTSCDNEWNTDNCYDGHLKGGIYSHLKSEEELRIVTNGTVKYNTNSDLSQNNGTLVIGVNQAAVNALNGTYFALENKSTPAEEYFQRGLMNLDATNNMETLGNVRWQLVLCLLAVYIICYFSLWKGISTSGKVVWFTAIFPYIVLFILLIRGVTLPGASEGIKYYLTPKWERLAKSEVWVDAATQVFFSLGPGFGVLLAFASYNKFHNNVYLDALATSSINCLTSFLSGFVIFSVLGYMAEKSGRTVADVATQGPGLVFIVYPEAIATLPVPTFWALIFFMMLLTLGLDSSFGGSEAIITALSDEFPWIKKHREIFVGILFSFYFLVGLASCTQGGDYVVTLMDKFAAGYSILFAVFFETLAISWLYGVGRFSKDIESMIGYKPGIYWKLCWKFIAPVFIASILVFGFVMYESPKYADEIEYPWWAILMGWCMALSSILCMPLVGLYLFIVTPGTIRQRLKTLTTPWRDSQRLTIGNHHGETKANGSHALEEV